MSAFLIILFSPLLVLFGAVMRGIMLFYPTMLFFGVVHGFLPWVPAFGWHETLAIIVLISLLIPVGSSTKAD